ncbi:N-terminal region of Chorein, a TM vesicle-mediated sorter-domain-containing protein [Pavlovales sp. CCMP2436]|nr:N-terminal region of Chorein, a TM vesicle-mediated sorter-domain-containing protein [Pavlovales sp. CCMP2436]
MWQTPIQSLALALLERALGKYVKGLDADSLQVALLSGQVVLRNLELKREALFELGLPVNIEAGFIGRVEITLPAWTRLGSEPVRVVVSQLQLVATPIDPAQWDEADRDNWRWARKQAKIETLSALHAAMHAHAEAAAPAAAAEGAAEPAGGGSTSSRLMSKMLANLELTLEGVHVRYKDSSASAASPDPATTAASAPSAARGSCKGPGGRECAAGVLIERIRVFSADASWAAAFSSDPALQRKRVILEGLRIYLQLAVARSQLIGRNLRTSAVAPDSNSSPAPPQTGPAPGASSAGSTSARDQVIAIE